MEKKMTLDEEMKIWENRANDNFGTFLKTVEQMLSDYLLSEDSGYGYTSNYIQHLRSVYSLDGDINPVFNNLVRFLQNYDYCNLKNPSWSNHTEVANLVINFANENKLNIIYIEF